MIFNVNSGAGKIPVNVVPSTNSSFTYDGTDKTPVWQNFDPEQLTIGGVTSAIDAGTYTVYFTPKADYEWLDGTSTPKEVTWSIAKAEGSLSLSATSGTIAGKNKTTTFTVTRAGDGAISVQSSNTGVATVSISGSTVTVTSKAYGSATITVSVAEGANHKAPSSKTYALTVSYLYLYNSGNECTSVTGGWMAYATSLPDTTPKTPNVTKGSNYLKLTNSTNEPYARGGAAVTTNKISFNGFSALKFTGTATGEGNARCMIRVWTQLNSNIDTYKVADYYFPSGGISNQTVSLNVSSLNGSYHVGIYAYTSNHTITMNKMWLE